MSGNSRKRRAQKRAEDGAARGRLWFVLEHPLLASGAGAMLLTGIATEISGWPTFAAFFYLGALLLLIVVFIRADLFRVSPKTAWGVLGLSTVLLAVLWVTIRPSPPKDPNVPDLVGKIRFVGKADMPDQKATLFIIYATIANAGAPSVVNDVALSVNIQGESVTTRRYTKELVLQLMCKGAGKEYQPSSLDELALDRPIPTGGQIAGAVSFLLPNVSKSSLGSTPDFLLQYSDVTGKIYHLSISDYQVDRDEDCIPRLAGSKAIRRIEPSKSQ